MIPDLMPPCALNISIETLSAWRDSLIDPAQAAELRRHLPTCPACQQRLAAFDAIRHVLRRQRELEPGNRIIAGVQRRMARANQRSATMSRQSFWGAAVAAVLIVVIFAAGLYVFTHRGTMSVAAGSITVPNFVGGPYANAKTRTHQLGLQLAVKEVPSADAQQNQVLAQDPPAGAKVNPGATVTVTVGEGTNFAIVPNVDGQSITGACKTLTNTGFVCSQVTVSVENSTFPQGEVDHTVPAAGIGTSKGTVVTLYISGSGSIGTQSPSSPITIKDPSIAAGVKVVFVYNNDVWLSVGGNAPQRILHPNVSGDFNWSLSWSPDQTKVLAVAANVSGTSASGWVISLPGDTSIALSSTNALFDECGPCTYTWLNDRDVFYIDPLHSGAHEASYQLFDTQTQQMLTTAIDRVELPYRPIAINGEMYFVNETFANSSSCPDTVVERYDPTTNSITQVVTLVGSAVDIGIPFGGFSISSDGQSIVAATSKYSGGSNCQINPNYAPVVLQRADGTVIPLFPDNQNSAPPALSPDAQHAVIQLSSAFEQESIATKTVYHNAADSSVSGIGYPIWFGTATPGLFYEGAAQLPDGTVGAYVLEYAPVDSNAAFTPVMTLAVDAVAFAQD